MYLGLNSPHSIWLTASVEIPINSENFSCDQLRSLLKERNAKPSRRCASLRFILCSLISRLTAVKRYLGILNFYLCETSKFIEMPNEPSSIKLRIIS